VLHSPIGLIP